MTDPMIEVYNTAGERIAVNDNWPPSLQTTLTKVGAFQVPVGSKDAAVLLSLVPGGYTAQLTGVNGVSGSGLIEVYEVGN
jgi:hypothetical protein